MRNPDNLLHLCLVHDVRGLKNNCLVFSIKDVVHDVSQGLFSI